jgi:hypothetical protein
MDVPMMILVFRNMNPCRMAYMYAYCVAGKPLTPSWGKSRRNYMGNDIGVAGQREWHCAIELGCSA